MRLFWRRKKLTRLLKKVAANDSELRNVDLYGKRIGDDGAKRLAKALRGNTVVTALFLWDNSISSEGARTLVDMLKYNSTIILLSLCENSIGDEGARALAEALEVNASITGLGLSGNGISDEGARALVEALRHHNSSVKILRLEGNSISDAGARDLVEMLHVNSFITDLNLLGNCYTSNKHQQRVDELTKINRHAPTPEEARRLKIVCKVEWWLVDSEVDAETAAAVDLALDQLGSFQVADERRELFGQLLGSPQRGKDVAASVDLATARTLYWCVADCGAAPTVVMNLIRVHPSLCACRDARHGLFPFMLFATMAEAGVGDVLELLLLNPILVESGINIAD